MHQGNNILRYHQASLDLIHASSNFSVEAEIVLNQLEQVRQFVLPASVREWYSLEHGVSMLEKYSGDDHVVPLEQLGSVDRYWSGGSYHAIDLFAKGLLPILVENQGVCTWAIQLNGSDDPPVVVSFDNTMPYAKFLPYVDSFSGFVYTRIWDYRGILSDYVLYGNEPALSSIDLTFLRSQFQSGLQTQNYPGLKNYRFLRNEQGIVLWEGKDQVDWWLFADSEEQLDQLVRMVWLCGGIAQHLEGYTPSGDAVLAKINKYM